jgi:hypothetical protein
MKFNVGQVYIKASDESKIIYYNICIAIQSSGIRNRIGENRSTCAVSH